MRALELPRALDRELRGALGWRGVEEVAFLFTEPESTPGILRACEIHRVPADGFEYQSDVHVSLTDDTRAYVIARAWAIGGGLVEAHSHRYGPAMFSPSDLFGFTDWVPHVRWRLHGRPYLALVLAPDGFDALVWGGPSGGVSPLGALLVDGQDPRRPTGLTYRQLTAGNRR